MTSLSEFELRPHHSLCIQFFRGEGYNQEFVQAMSQITDMLEKENPFLTLTEHCDIICENCPNNIRGICSSDRKVTNIDKRCIEKYDMRFGDTIRWSELKKLAYEHIISKNQLATVCHNCQWRTLCVLFRGSENRL